MKPKHYKAGLRCLLLLTIICLGTAGMKHANAQTLHASAHGDDTLTSSYNGYLNCANIDYSPTCSCTPGGTYQLTAVTIDDGSGNSYLIINDGVGSTLTITITGAQTPDVVIGNNTTTISHNMVGVVYAKTNSSATCVTNGLDIYMDVYDVSGVGTGTLSYTAATSGLLLSSGQGTVNPYPHIDIVAQYSISIANNYPTCDLFVAAFSDPVDTLSCNNMDNAYFGVNLYKASLNSPSVGTAVVDLYCDTSLTTPQYVDVAAIEQGPNGDIVAIYTYAWQGTGEIFFSSYDFNTGIYGASTPTGTAFDVGFGISSVYPRIDAIDNINSNSNSGSNAYFQIVAQNSGLLGRQQIWTWNHPPNSGAMLSGFAPTYDYTPVITQGPGSSFTAAYYHADGNDDYISQSISWLGIPNITDYYKINHSTVNSSSNRFNAISSTCNNDGSVPGGLTPQLFGCWNNITAGPTNRVYWKQASAVTAWKEAPTNVIQLPTMPIWAVGPNPATDYLMISAPTGIASAEKNSLQVSDMAGRILIQAGINRQTTQLNINTLAQGIYLLHIYEDAQEVKTVKFVKE